MLEILTQYITRSGIVLGQKNIHTKTNEIPVFQEIFEMIDVTAKMITDDATHYQKETCRKIFLIN